MDFVDYSSWLDGVGQRMIDYVVPWVGRESQKISDEEKCDYDLWVSVGNFDGCIGVWGV